MAEPVDYSFGSFPKISRVSPVEAQNLRDQCDAYRDVMDPCARVPGGWCTRFDADGSSMVRDLAKASLYAYNHDRQKNFYLQKVVKVNNLPLNSYMTFWAESESEGRRLFRAVANGLGGYHVFLCEIKDDEEITIPAGHKDYVVETESADDRTPDIWNESYITDGFADFNWCKSGAFKGGDQS